jgi:hypothetical protein
VSKPRVHIVTKGVELEVTITYAGQMEVFVQFTVPVGTLGAPGPVTVGDYSTSLWRIASRRCLSTPRH